MKEKQKQQNMIHLGTHGEDYGNWMSNPVLYTIGGLLVVTGAVASLASTVFHVTVLSGLALIAAISLLLLLCWCGWIRRQYAFGGGGMMERVHHTVLSYLDFDGQGQLLDVGCGSGALRDSFWTWAAAPAHYPSGRPSSGRMPKSPASTIGVQPMATDRLCAKGIPPVKA